MRRRRVSACAAALLLVAAMPAIAHDPTPNRDGDGYTGSQTLRRVWNADPSPPSWVKTGVDLAIDHAPSSVADIPTFSTSSGISGPVYYRTRAIPHARAPPGPARTTTSGKATTGG